MAVPVFCDNDIILKLAAFDLLDALCEALDVTRDQVQILSTAYHVFSNPGKRRELAGQYGDQGLERAIAFAREATPICDAPDPAEQAILASIEQLDAGEALLLAATKAAPDFIVLTGDKRCLIALAGCPEARMIRERLRNRVVCFEELIRTLVRSAGFSRVRDGVALSLRCDKALLSVFGSAAQHTEDEVLRHIDSYVADLVSRVGPDWLGRV